MKPVNVGAKERADIDAQVDKIIRGLGRPEPPLRLEDVRELLRLDLQYYSSTNDSALREFVSKVRIAGKQLFMRPALLLDVVKKADLSALWVPDRSRILIDQTLPLIKRRWAEGHETSHSLIEWHKLYLFGDSTKELDPTCSAILEAEANYGAGQLLFLRDRFLTEALDFERCIKTVTTLSKRFGNTLTSTLWRYVEHVGVKIPIAGLVTPHPHRLPDGHNPSAPCKYFIVSPAFDLRFSNVAEREMFEALSGYCRNAKGGPLGEDDVILRDVNGTPHVFRFETFFNGHEALTLCCWVQEQSLIVSAS